VRRRRRRDPRGAADRPRPVGRVLRRARRRLRLRARGRPRGAVLRVLAFPPDRRPSPPSRTMNRWTSPTHPIWRVALFVSAAATVAPLWVARHLPFTDLPQHAATIATLRHWLDPSWRAGDTYRLVASKTLYLLYYAVGALVAWPL